MEELILTARLRKDQGKGVARKLLQRMNVIAEIRCHDRQVGNRHFIGSGTDRRNFTGRFKCLRRRSLSDWR